ncbi:MAG: hypothetical protein ACLR5J_01745 [Lachnospiraceae bacterium]
MEEDRVISCGGSPANDLYFVVETSVDGFYPAVHQLIGRWLSLPWYDSGGGDCRYLDIQAYVQANSAGGRYDFGYTAGRNGGSETGPERNR